MFLIFSNHFDVLISKIIFKKLKIIFDAFPSKRYFEKQPQPHFQTGQQGVLCNLKPNFFFYITLHF